jgi:hypothetical protein
MIENDRVGPVFLISFLGQAVFGLKFAIHRRQGNLPSMTAYAKARTSK